MYKNNGMCRVADITETDFGAGERPYYILESVYDEKSSVYVPVGSPLEVSMHHILSAGEINAIIDATGKCGGEWINDAKEREARFSEMLSSGDRADALWLVKTISLKRTEAIENKKKLRASDEKILDAAQKSITEEFAFVLGIDKNEVIPYIIGRMSGNN